MADNIFTQLGKLFQSNVIIRKRDDNKLVVKDLIDEGKTEEEIYAFMSDKYGEWIVFKPQFNIQNSILWTLPYIVLIFGGFFIISFLKKRQ